MSLPCVSGPRGVSSTARTPRSAASSCAWTQVRQPPLGQSSDEDFQELVYDTAVLATCTDRVGSGGLVGIGDMPQ